LFQGPQEPSIHIQTKPFPKRRPRGQLVCAIGRFSPVSLGFKDLTFFRWYLVLHQVHPAEGD